MSSINLSVQERLLTEYALLREGLLFDVGDRALLELTGKDRASFLHNFCTNDIKGLRPGNGCEAFLTNIKGRILEHLFVFADADSLWVDGTPGYEEAVRAHLDRYLITEDVEIHPRSDGRGMVWVVGSGVANSLQAMAGDGPLPETHLAHSWITAKSGERIHCRRCDLGGFPAWQLCGAQPAIAETTSRLKEAGIRPGSAELLNALRIESGLPRYGVDITDENLAQESRRTAAAISFTKGCYLGQEPIARIDALGHVNRELCVLEASPGGEDIPVGTPLIDQAGATVGELTSVAWHPRTQSTWGLAVLKRSASAEGAQLVAGNSGAAVTVHPPLAAERA